MKTQNEIRDYLKSIVGTSQVPGQDYQGQCVSLIKALFAFLGVPNPYGARGNATDTARNYVNEGIALSGGGWLQVCVNHDDAGGLGHVWLDIAGEANYQQNAYGNPTVVSGTADINHAQTIVNLDQWVEAPAAVPAPDNAPTAAMPVISELALRAYRGEFGNGQERRVALGPEYDEVQNYINAKYASGEWK